MEYKGKVMDPFQVEAVEELKSDNSVVVAAPTGCGKTLIAEYLLDKFLQKGERAIYTAPIKALSNQKYRDFSLYYGDKVGMLTGDVSINPSAQILIMTTEIFRNMLFAEKEELSDVKYVIFDEIHYINDIQRGVIWEESIIFALSHMRFLALSATIPNAAELAGWIESIKGHNVKLIEKTERPVPLYHNIFSKKTGVTPVDKFLVKVNDRNIRNHTKNFNIRHINDLVHDLQKKDLLPAINFVFSREGCFRYAKEVTKQFDFLTKEQKKRVSSYFNEVTEKFGIKDMKSVDMLRRFAMNGVGVHNAGILPVLKEVVEVLFGEGLLKVIFVTETFAVGVNMPARAAVFVSLEKYDGISFRYLKNNEYYQMAGRAGRRGIDKKGYVISIIDSAYLKLDEVRRIMDESLLEPLESQFKLSYNTVVNLVDQYDLQRIREILKMSFAQYLAFARKEELSDKIGKKSQAVDHARDNIHCGDYEEFKRYQSLVRKKFRFTTGLKKTRDLIRSGRVGQKRMKNLKRDESRFKQKLNRVNRKLSNVKCQKCEDREICKVMGTKIRAYNSRIDELKERAALTMPDHYENFLKKYRFLEKEGYIENRELTYRGKIASRIYGYELMVTELAMQGVFTDYSTDEINVLCSCMIYELNPKKDGNLKVKRDDYFRKTREAKKVVERIRKSEIREGMEPSKGIYLDIIPVAKAWTEGASFSELLPLTYLSEGDLIRHFRQVIDLLQQIKRVFDTDEMLVQKIKACLEKVNRDIVNVSEYVGEESAQE